MGDYEELKVQAEALVRELECLRQRERGRVLSEVCARVAKYALQVTEIYGAAHLREFQSRSNPRKMRPKYRDPVIERDGAISEAV